VPEDRVADSIAQADREAAIGDFRAAAGLFCYVTMRLWMQSKLLRLEMDELKAGRCEHQSAPEPGESTQHPDSCW
jgi:hypothetical protein